MQTLQLSKKEMLINIKIYTMQAHTRMDKHTHTHTHTHIHIYIVVVYFHRIFCKTS